MKPMLVWAVELSRGGYTGIFQEGICIEGERREICQGDIRGSFHINPAIIIITTALKFKYSLILYYIDV